MWWWILVWALLLVGAAMALALVGWHVVKKGIALGRQLGTSAEQVSRLLEPIQAPYRPAASVLSDPSTLPDTAGPSRSRPGAGVGRRRR
ncbi:hypothetical protein GCM10027446_07270 [Angustibacter peucedani]